MRFHEAKGVGPSGDPWGRRRLWPNGGAGILEAREGEVGSPGSRVASRADAIRQPPRLGDDRLERFRRLYGKFET